MPTFILRHIDPDLWSRLQAKAAAEGITIKALILKALAQYVALVVLTLVVGGCDMGARNLAGPTPSPQPSALSPQTSLATITGHVIATNGGQPLSGLHADLGGAPTTTDGAGVFSLVLASSSGARLTLNGGGIVPRSLVIATGTTHDVHVDAFAADFDLAFYRAFVRNGYDAPAGLQPLRRLTVAPHVYLRTVDDAGRAIDAVTLDTTETALRDVAPLWSGGQFGLASVERGTETREGQTGWLTVSWLSTIVVGMCGRSDVGRDGGVIAFDYLEPNCSCPGSRIRPSAVKHELGHAFGFYHTGDGRDLMSGLPNRTCDQMPSAREVDYARFAYARPIGNVDPDSDPAGAVTSLRVQ